jgi:hypothetical protein
MVHPMRHSIVDFGELEFGYRPADKPHKGKQLVGQPGGSALQRGLEEPANANPVEVARNWRAPRVICGR